MRLLLGWGRIDRGSGFDKRAIDVIKGVSGLQNGHSLRRATARRKSPKANRPARCAGKCRKWSLPAKAPAHSCQNCPIFRTQTNTGAMGQSTVVQVGQFR
jgi:hypothetical protein